MATVDTAASFASRATTRAPAIGDCLRESMTLPWSETGEKHLGSAPTTSSQVRPTAQPVWATGEQATGLVVVSASSPQPGAADASETAQNKTIKETGGRRVMVASDFLDVGW